MKKTAFYAKQGTLGTQVLYVMKSISPEIRYAILQNAKRVYGEKYIYWLLTKNPIKIAYRSIRRLFIKLFIEGI